VNSGIVEEKENGRVEIRRRGSKGNGKVNMGKINSSSHPYRELLLGNRQSLEVTEGIDQT